MSVKKNSKKPIKKNTSQVKPVKSEAEIAWHPELKTTFPPIYGGDYGAL